MESIVDMFTLDSGAINMLFGIMDVLIERGDISIEDLEKRAVEYQQFNFPQGIVTEGMQNSLDHLREKYKE